MPSVYIFRMETDYASTTNQKNEAAQNPHYNWKNITPEFFESIKGNIIYYT